MKHDNFFVSHKEYFTFSSDFLLGNSLRNLDLVIIAFDKHFVKKRIVSSNENRIFLFAKEMCSGKSKEHSLKFMNHSI